MADMSLEEIKQAADLLRDPGAAGLTDDEAAYLANMVSGAAKSFAESRAAGPVKKTATAAFDALNYLGGLQDLGWGVAAGGAAEALGTGKFKDVVKKEDVLAAINPADLTIATDPGTYFERAGMPGYAAMPAGILASIMGPGLVTKLPKLGVKALSSAEKRILQKTGKKSFEEITGEGAREAAKAATKDIKEGKKFSLTMGPESRYGDSTIGRFMSVAEDPIAYLNELVGEKILRTVHSPLDIATEVKRAGRPLPATDIVVDEARGAFIPGMPLTTNKVRQSAERAVEDSLKKAAAIEEKLATAPGLGLLAASELGEKGTKMAGLGQTRNVISKNALLGDIISGLRSGENYVGAEESARKAANTLSKEFGGLDRPWKIPTQRTEEFAPIVGETAKVAKSKPLPPEIVGYVPEGAGWNPKYVPIPGTPGKELFATRGVDRWVYKSPLQYELVPVPGRPLATPLIPAEATMYNLGELKDIKSRMYNLAKNQGGMLRNAAEATPRGTALQPEIVSSGAMDIASRASKEIEKSADTIKQGGQYALENLRAQAALEAINKAYRNREGFAESIAPGAASFLGQLMMSEVGRRLPRAGLTSAFGGYSAAPSQEELDMQAIMQELEKYKK